VNAGP